MIYQISHNIVSSLGFSSEDNYNALKSGKTNLRLQENTFHLPEPFVGALVDDELLNAEFEKINNTNIQYTKFEKMAIVSVAKALQKIDINPKSPKVQFILSTTKGNVHLLEDLQGFPEERVFLWKSAEIIAQFFGNNNEPIVISNACISGASAQIAAMRMLQSNACDIAIVVGADVLSKFIVSGFQSFKALSPELCKPYDKNRVGLNLGEAAATIIYGKSEKALPKNSIILTNGAMANDANHISGPSRTGAGLYIALKKAMGTTSPSEIAFVNAHGTATAYNDDMESLALTSALLQDRPINSLKAYFGHTLGAAGVLESIISSLAIIDNTVLKVNNLTERGTVAPINSIMENQRCTENKFIKALSGFGGSNAALLFTKVTE
ncbi:MAG: beta-ketoacyl synthase [Bacteroidales bacterium]|nr:beta-ketoacyl synthase [Bacteroidales bacterium]